jgi:hypothetical protein
MVSASNAFAGGVPQSPGNRSPEFIPLHNQRDLTAGRHPSNHDSE